MKGKNILAISIAVMVLSIAISCVYAEDKMELRLRLEKGQSYKTKTVQDMKINQTIPGQQQAMTIIQKTEGRNIYTVEDVQSDGTAVVKVTYDAILFKMETMGGKGGMGENIEYDSTNPSAAVGPMALIFNAIVGQSLIITLTPDGHVKEIQGADALFKRMQEKVNELPDAQMRAAMETNLKTQHSKEALKANTENSFNMYPDNPVGIGDTWQKRTTMTQGFPMIIDSIYTLKERKDGIATIDVFAMIQSNKEAGPMKMGPVKLHYNISGSVTGLMEMEESTGWAIRSNQGLRLSGSATVASPEMRQPMTIPISMSGTITKEPY